MPCGGLDQGPENSLVRLAWSENSSLIWFTGFYIDTMARTGAVVGVSEQGEQDCAFHQLCGFKPASSDGVSIW